MVSQLADLIIVVLNRPLVALRRFAEPVASCEDLGLMLQDELDGAFDFLRRYALLCFCPGPVPASLPRHFPRALA
jgi:hypothetical protein